MVSVTASYQQSIAIYKTSYHCLLSLNLLCLGYALVPPFQIQPAITPSSADSYKNPWINCSWMGPLLPSPYSHVRVVHDFFFVFFSFVLSQQGQTWGYNKRLLWSKETVWRYYGVIEEPKKIQQSEFPPLNCTVFLFRNS